MQRSTVHPLNLQLRERKAAGEKLAVLTAYDYPTSRLLDEAGIDLILVGDSLGMVVLGLPDTTGVTMEMMLHHVAAVRRGAKRAPVIGDLPYQSYTTPELALANAKRLIEAGADAVKLEGGVGFSEQVKAITDAGIGYVGHIGMLPQSVKLEGGYKKKGKTAEDALHLMDDALALEAAGAAAIVLESMMPEVATKISQSLKIPTIGIGAGSGCDAQVLVTPDLIGAYPWFKPPFARSHTNVALEITKAVRRYIGAVKD
jgi:3-methyl-2-oxobutanoate hydroxymethyltransferase